MSAEYKGQDPLEIAKQAERELNSQQAKGNAASGISDSGMPNLFPSIHKEEATLTDISCSWRVWRERERLC